VQRRDYRGVHRVFENKWVFDEKWVWRLVGAIGLALIIFPGIDLFVSRQFFMSDVTDRSANFVLASEPVSIFAHEVVMRSFQALALALVGGFLYCAIRLRRLCGLGTLQWLFLALALALGPGLVANVLFKETWDRARPFQVEEFGGWLEFTPPLVLSDQCHHNCSFVSGDAAAGFFLHSFAYVARRRRRVIFYGGLGVGLLVGVMRIAQGAHFLSDVLYAGAFMVACTAAVHALLYGRAATAAWWRSHVLPARGPERGGAAAEPWP
jgi:lipid A 4'-phosphatase